MAFHLESLTREYVRSGMSQADAEQAARRRFGNRLRLKEEGHDIRSAPLVEHLMRDVRHTGRGACAAAPGSRWRSSSRSHSGSEGIPRSSRSSISFSCVPSPIPNGERLLMVHESMPSVGDKVTVSPANWLDWQRDSRTLQTLAAWRSRPMTLTGQRRADAAARANGLFGVLPGARRRTAAGAHGVGAGRPFRMLRWSPCSAIACGGSASAPIRA